MFAGRNTRTSVITIIFFDISLVCKKFLTHCFVKIIYAQDCFSVERLFLKPGNSTDKTTIDSARIPFLYWKERQQWQIERSGERSISVRCPVLNSGNDGRACRCEHLFTFRSTSNNNGSVFNCWNLIFIEINQSFLRHWYIKRGSGHIFGPNSKSILLITLYTHKSAFVQVLTV